MSSGGSSARAIETAETNRHRAASAGHSRIPKLYAAFVTICYSDTVLRSVAKPAQQFLGARAFTVHQHADAIDLGRRTRDQHDRPDQDCERDHDVDGRRTA